MKKIEGESDPKRLAALKYILANEYHWQHRWADAEAILLEIHRAAPDEPLPLLSLAGSKLYYERRPEAAMPYIDQAIEVACRTGVFRQLALGTKARVALELGAYRVVEDILQQLMELKFSRESVDCGIERDFFERLPAGTIDANVARRYDDFSREKN